MARTTAYDLALVTYEALTTEGWTEEFAEALASAVRRGGKRLAVLLADGPRMEAA